MPYNSWTDRHEHYANPDEPTPTDDDATATPHQRAVERYCADHALNYDEVMHSIQYNYLPSIGSFALARTKLEEACYLWLSIMRDTASDDEPTESTEPVEALYADMEVDLTRARTIENTDYALYDGHVRLTFDRDSAAGIVGALVKDLDLQPDDLLPREINFGERACLRCRRRASTDTDNTAGFFCQPCLKDIAKQSMTSGSRRATVGNLSFNMVDLDIVCRRDKKGTLHFNISQAFVWHSPDGFEISYPGSGPADFAYNVLALFIGEKRTLPLYQEFKSDFIENMSAAGGVIHGKSIITWIYTHERRLS